MINQAPTIPDPYTDEDVRRFADDARFAKIVVGPGRQESLLIAGKLYLVLGPDGSAADLFSRVLRRSVYTEGQTGGSAGAVVGFPGAPSVEGERA